MYTEEQLNELLTCPKKVTEGWREIKDTRHGVKKVLCLSSLDGKYEFTAFCTQNLYFSEDFSIGLVYVPKTIDGKQIIIRCNSAHGPTISAKGHHVSPHIHKPIAEEINKGNKRELRIEQIDDYTTFEGGLHYFGKLINVIPDHKNKHFPSPKIPGGKDLFGNDL
jgi:hypothetical protein